MKFDSRIFGVSLLLGLVAWVADAFLAALVFQEGSLPDLVLLDVPPEHLAIRFVVLALFLFFGFGLSAYLSERNLVDWQETRRALEKSEARFKDLANLLPEPVFETDLSFTITYANRRAFELFGYKPRDLSRGLEGPSMLVPEDRDRADEVFQSMLRGEDPGVTEFTGLRKDGTTFPMLFHAAVAREQGRPVGLRGVIVDITHRKEAEEVLKQSEERFRNIVESSPMGVFLYEMQNDGRLILVDANPAANEILGVDMSEFTGMTLEEAFPPLAETEIPHRYREAAAAGIPWHSRQVDYDHGDIRGAYEVTAFQTAPNQVAVMFLDITERMKAEEAVRTSEERLRLATQMGRVGTWEYHLDSDKLEWDPLMYELYGVDPSDPETGIERWRACVHPEDLDRAESEFRDALSNEGSPFDIEFRILRGGAGEIRHIRGLAGVFREEDGTPVRMVGTNWDITQSKHFEEVLRGSEERFRGVVEQLNDATYILFNGRFDLVNPRFCELTGVTADEASRPDFNFWDLVAPGSIPVIRKRQELRDRGEEVPGIYEFEIRHRDGHLVQVEASVTEIDYRGGTAVLGLLRDITVQKELKEQLLLAQRMESIGRLSGGVAHDLNNLLTPILGYGDLLVSEFSPDDERRESVEEMLEAGYRAKDLVHQLLAFGRKQAMEFKALDLNEMIEGFQGLLRRTIRESIEIRFTPAPSNPVIRGDKGQLEQVLMNLVVNAQDAMPDGGTLIIEADEVELDEEYARTHSGVQAGNYGLVSVSDTGMGMDHATREKIFEPFFTTKEQGKGTGLGLATVYGIIKQHEGNIWAFSEPGEGTTFKCYLPLADKFAMAEMVPRESGGAAPGTGTVLVVEDEEAVRRLAVKVLERNGYTVLAAGDGHAVKELLDTHEGPLDLLLTDVVMPGLDGHQLHQDLLCSYPDLNVLFMSGYSEDIISHNGALDRGIPFLQKPFTVRTLVTRVREVMEGDAGT